MPQYSLTENLLSAIEFSPDATQSKTIYRDERVKIVLFALAGGQEMTRHAAAVPAILQILKGDARVTLDDEERELAGGSLACMQANLPHSIYARGDVIMLLTMLTGG